MNISVIIPVYNVREYILRCIRSVLRQNNCQYEIIVVDDGSPDDSIELLKSFLSTGVKNSEKVKIIHKINGGLSSARNAGLKEAAGEYVWFVDSDDEIEENCLEKLYGIASENQLDALFFDMTVKSDCGDHHNDAQLRDGHLSPEIMSGEKMFCRMREKKCYHASACGYMLRRCWLLENHIDFYEGILHEDELFTPVMMLQAKRTMYTAKAPYIRYVREGSITTAESMSRRMHSLGIVLEKLAMFEKKVPEGPVRKAFDDNAVGLASIFFGELSRIGDISEVLQKSESRVRGICKEQKWRIPLDVKLYILKNKLKVRFS